MSTPTADETYRPLKTSTLVAMLVVLATILTIALGI